MSHRFILFCVLSICGNTIQGAAELKKETERKKSMEEVMPDAPRRVVLMFFDDEERADEPGIAITIDLIAALTQKAAPVVASRHLLSVIHELYTPFGLAQDMPISQAQEKDRVVDVWMERLNQAFQKKLPENFQTLSENEKNKAIATIEQELQAGALKEGFPVPKKINEIIPLIRSIEFKPEEWIIASFGQQDSLVLLVPKTYLNSLQISLKEVIQGQAEITEAEFQLGLKFNHMKIISPKDFWEFIEIPFKNNETQYRFEALWNAQKKESDIFVTRSEYRKAQKKAPVWTLFLAGHGYVEKPEVAGLTIAHFKKLLNFLETEIFTNFFVYSSCFSAGINLELIYKKTLSDPLYKGHSFAIAFEGIIELTTFAAKGIKLENLTSAHIDATTKKIQSMGVEEEPLFDRFVEFTTTEPLAYEKALFAVFRKKTAEYMPQIKFPGIPFFKIIDIDRKLCRIGSILASSRNPEKPLSIEEFFGKKSKADSFYIGLETPYIPFPIIFDSDKISGIISMIPDDAVHVMESANAPDMSLAEFALKIAQFNYIVTKRFWIKEFKCKSFTWKKKGRFGGSSLVGKPIIKNLVIEVKEEDITVSFHSPKNNQRYIVTVNRKEDLKDSLVGNVHIMNDQEIKEEEELLDDLINEPITQAEEKKFKEKQARIQEMAKIIQERRTKTIEAMREISQESKEQAEYKKVGKGKWEKQKN